MTNKLVDHFRTNVEILKVQGYLKFSHVKGKSHTSERLIDYILCTALSLIICYVQ